ncbi:hypothetical protein MIDIC_140054 [Alphaproteobacteria bacterium]
MALHYKKSTNFTFLKFAIFTMNLLFGMGVLFSIYMICKHHNVLFGSSTKQEDGSSGTSSAVCKISNMRLDMLEQVEHFQINGNQLLILSKPRNSIQELTVVDLCKTDAEEGKISKIEIHLSGSKAEKFDDTETQPQVTKTENSAKNKSATGISESVQKDMYSNKILY